jgi:hypothetical protein
MLFGRAWCLVPLQEDPPQGFIAQEEERARNAEAAATPVPSATASADTQTPGAGGVRSMERTPDCSPSCVDQHACTSFPDLRLVRGRRHGRLGRRVPRQTSAVPVRRAGVALLTIVHGLMHVSDWVLSFQAVLLE